MRTLGWRSGGRALEHQYLIDDNPSPAMLEQIYRLRVRAWRARTMEFADGRETWSDSYDEISHHFAVCTDGLVIAAARLTIGRNPREGPDGRTYRQLKPDLVEPTLALMSRLVVCPAHARRGLSQLLDRRRIAFASDAGCKTILVGARPTRISNLESMGFRVLYQAEVLADGPLQHVVPPIVMVLRL